MSVNILWTRTIDFIHFYIKRAPTLKLLIVHNLCQNWMLYGFGKDSPRGGEDNDLYFEPPTKQSLCDHLWHSFLLSQTNYDCWYLSSTTTSATNLILGSNNHLQWQLRQLSPRNQFRRIILVSIFCAWSICMFYVCWSVL